MSEQTSIEWCDSTFNPWIGCTRVSPACDDCYAARSTPARTLGVAWGAGQPRRRTAEATWNQPEAWERGHAEFYAKHRRRRRVFCASLADVFDNEVPVEWRIDLFRLIASTPHLDWLLLTKRIGNAQGMLPHSWLYEGAVPGNVWLGATVVNQAEADRDVPKLLAVPARVRFLSIEPMLGPIDLRELVTRSDRMLTEAVDALRGELTCVTDHGSGRTDRCARLDWVICGGESGPKARPMHPDWARSLRDQCAAGGVAFLFKQWGEWTDERHVQLDQPIATRLRKTVSRLDIEGRVHPMSGPGPERYAGIYRVGKEAAGRLLDGRTHDGFPEVSHG